MKKKKKSAHKVFHFFKKFWKQRIATVHSSTLFKLAGCYVNFVTLLSICLRKKYSWQIASGKSEKKKRVMRVALFCTQAGRKQTTEEVFTYIFSWLLFPVAMFIPWPLPLDITVCLSSFIYEGKKRNTSLTVFNEARTNWAEGSAQGLPQLPPVKLPLAIPFVVAAPPPF